MLVHILVFRADESFLGFIETQKTDAEINTFVDANIQHLLRFETLLGFLRVDLVAREGVSPIEIIDIVRKFAAPPVDLPE